MGQGCLGACLLRRLLNSFLGLPLINTSLANVACGFVVQYLTVCSYDFSKDPRLPGGDCERFKRTAKPELLSPRVIALRTELPSESANFNTSFSAHSGARCGCFPDGATDVHMRRACYNNQSFDTPSAVQSIRVQRALPVIVYLIFKDRLP